MTALDHLGVARRDLDPGRRGGQGDGLDLGAQDVCRESLLEDHREAQRERPRAAHGEVVDGAVDGQLADRAAREAQGLDDEAVGREGQPRTAGLDRRDIGERLQSRRGECGHEDALDQRLRGLAAGAVRHRDVRVAQLWSPRALLLDDVEDPLLALAHARARHRHTNSRSRAKRP